MSCNCEGKKIENTSRENKGAPKEECKISLKSVEFNEKSANRCSNIERKKSVSGSIGEMNRYQRNQPRIDMIKAFGDRELAKNGLRKRDGVMVHPYVRAVME